MDANCGNKEKHSWLKTGSSSKVELTIGFAELFNTDRKTKTTDLNYFHLSWHNAILLTSTKAVFPGKDLTINYAALKWTPEVKFCSAFLSSCLHCCFCSAYLKTPEASRTLFQIKSLVKNLNGAHFSGFVLLFSCVKLRGTWLWNDLSEWVSIPSGNEVHALTFTWQSRYELFLSKIVSWPSGSQPFCKRYPCATRLRLHGLQFSFQNVVRFHLAWY